ncbi:MAG: STAS domain-containing protein [Desulfuromonadaceae bacterium]|nr:STAS domain-containing protein [Desulfuromonadaceae bacterium]MDD2847816.1 STAS domain-containing protein [Desulfuromonadaceae bacterium]MDD4129639.1 STAS domain-containing protein [Desulfuromonadaceae bacterium]
MPLNSSVRENGDIIVTSGTSLTIEHAAEFSRILREALEASGTVMLEFEPEVEIDITGVQVLCSACKNAAESGKVFSYHGPRPQAMTDIITSSGAERNSVCKHNNNSTCIWFGGVN